MTSKRIIPTIGRSLHFFANTESDLKLFGSVGPFACILCGVINDTTINVGVFTNEGTVVGRTGVPLLQGGEHIEEIIGQGAGSYCGWMPFQQGQAARTDSAEKVLFEQLASALERIAQLEALTGNIGAQRGDINQLRAGSTQRLEEAFEEHQFRLAQAKKDYEQEKGQRAPDEKTPMYSQDSQLANLGAIGAFDPAAQLQATEAARGLMDNAAGCEPAADTSSAGSDAACVSAGE